MTKDVRGSATWTVVEDYFTRALSPAFERAGKGLEPAATPDGSRIAFTATVLPKLEGLPRQGVFGLEGDQVVELTNGAGSARQPRFSPDGRSLSFLSDRAQAGVFQLYLLSTDRFGESLAAPAVTGTVEYSAWSPDGTKVLLGVAGLGADLAGGQGSGTTVAPVEDVPDWLPRVDVGVDDSAWRSLWLYDVASTQLSQLSPEKVNTWEAAWLGPDAVIAVTSDRPDEGAWYTAELTRIALDRTMSRVATSEVQLGWPSASPAGSRLAVVEAVCSDRWVVAGDLLVGNPGALERIDTSGVDVTYTQWVDEDRLGFLGIRGLETVAGMLDVTTGKTTELWASTDTSCGTRYPEGAFLADGRLVILEEGYRQPQQIVVLGESVREVRASLAHEGTSYILSVNGLAEPIAWSTPDGLRVEGILCRPNGEGPFPLVVNVHGGPVWAYRNLWSLSYAWTPLLVSQGYAVLNPNPRGSSGRGQEFARHVFGDMGGADTQDFLSGIDALVERGVADPERLAIMGGSYGGYMSSWLVTQDPRFAAAIPMSPVTDWYSQHFTSNIPFFDALFLDGDPERPGDNFHARSPVAHASKVRTPCLNIAGALDRCTPPGQAEEFHRALLEHGVESQLVIYPREGHGVRAFPAQIDLCTRILEFLSTHLRT
jgi:dipeptidyl aminopeptidase/acylaminoacyl peptidase